ncbi:MULTISPECIES: hypothetical protein [Bizionia]|uniref:Uncharacterized protein n=1 Tax=Bizionia algoritergicola TaxID=291187 RepID=A0A5D0QZ98_9FLAO|nr:MULTISPECIES: hypothetical protein [Bizionia]OBX17808.1 hypothetical protein BAA08_15750 [Bizionia sp. APA-3]TYB74572.1 hypothetical protein ES675_00055 [Bizionia algoritergicola]
MSLDKIIQNEALKQFKPKGIRKRFLVSEGDLFHLYKDIAIIRKQEDREHLMADFKKLLKEAKQVQLVEMPEEKKGGEHEH